MIKAKLSSNNFQSAIVPVYSLSNSTKLKLSTVFFQSPKDGALFNFKIPVTNFEESVLGLMQKLVRKKLPAPFCWMLNSNLGRCRKQFYKANALLLT